MNAEKAVIFDFDGTLADTHATLMSIIKNYHQELGCHNVTEAEAQKLRHKPVKEVCADLGISRWGLPLFIYRVKKHMGEVIHDIPLFKGIKESLKHLAHDGYVLGIVSSNNERNIRAFLRQNEIEDLFSFIGCCSSLLGKDKVLKKTLNTYKLNKETTIYVGDELRDIDAANSAGLKIVSVSWGFNDAAVLKEHSPAKLIDKPSQLHHAITALAK